MKTERSDTSKPLSDLRVVEVAHIVAGPFVGRLLADLGADVVKIESAEGDGLRQWPPQQAGPDGEFSLNFAIVNHGKRSVVLDLKSHEGKQTFIDLVGSADVLVENFRPGSLGRLGLSPDSLRERHPRLVWCSVSGFGQTGPLSGVGAYDVVVQGYSGMMSVTGTPDAEPSKCGVPVADYIAGLYGALAIMAALRRREETGQGDHLDCSMLGSLLAVSTLQISEYLGTGLDPQRIGSAHPRNAPYRAFACADGYITVAAGNERLWVRLCEELDRHDLLDREEFATQAARTQNQDSLFKELDALFRLETKQSWLDRLQRAGVPCGPVNTISEAISESQVDHLGLMLPMELPTGSSSYAVGFPVQSENWASEVSSPPPLGAHNDEVTREWLGR